MVLQYFMGGRIQCFVGRSIKHFLGSRSALMGTSAGESLGKASLVAALLLLYEKSDVT